MKILYRFLGNNMLANKADQDANRFQPKGESRLQERGQAVRKKKHCLTEIRGQMRNDSCRRPCLCRLIMLWYTLEFQFAVDRTKARPLENSLELKGKQTRLGVKHRSMAANWRDIDIRSLGTNILQSKYAVAFLTHMGRGYYIV